MHATCMYDILRVCLMQVAAATRVHNNVLRTGSMPRCHGMLQYTTCIAIPVLHRYRLVVFLVFQYCMQYCNTGTRIVYVYYASMGILLPYTRRKGRATKGVGSAIALRSTVAATGTGTELDCWDLACLARATCMQ